jgi:membrane protease YdiL (CAAX protease family)
VTARRAAGFRAAAWRGTAGLGAAALLRSSFAAQAGSARFYLLTAGLTGTWTGGALGAGPIPWRGEGWRTRPGSAARALIVVPVVTGAATFAVFYGAARAARRHRTLHRAIASVLRYADAGSTPLVVLIASGSGVAEELFFRGALWSGPRPLRTTTLAYAASTAATGNPALILAGLITSVIFGWQRAATGGVLAPALTHVTWSVLMLRYLPPLFRDADRAAGPPLKSRDDATSTKIGAAACRADLGCTTVQTADRRAVIYRHIRIVGRLARPLVVAQRKQADRILMQWRHSYAVAPAR